MAVHHRCITGTAFDGIWRNRPPSPKRMVEPKLATRGEPRRRIRLTGLLRKPLQNAGVSIWECITGASRTPRTGWVWGWNTNGAFGLNRLVEPRPRPLCGYSVSSAGHHDELLPMRGVVRRRPCRSLGVRVTLTWLVVAAGR